MFIFDDGVCVYPAQRLDKLKDFAKSFEGEKNFYQDIK